MWFVVSSAAMVPPVASGAKPQPSYSFNQPGQLFSVQPKVESSPSPSAATANQTWRIMESLNLGPPPKTTPVPSFPGVQGQASSTSCSNTASAVNQDYSTVNLSDLHEFFPNISSAITQEPASSQGSAASSQTSSSFTMQGSQFRVDPPIVDDDIPEFPSFSEAQAPGALENIDMGDFEDLLNPNLISDCGNGTSILGQAPCQQGAPPSSSSKAHNSAAAAMSPAMANTTDPASNPGSTWMNYPNSIVSLLQNEAMIESSPSNNHRPLVLDEFDELMSADEDRLISIFNNAGQARFVSGHPT